MNLTPRQQFQENVKNAQSHRDLVMTDRFREACHASLLEQVLNMPNTNDPDEAAALYHQIVGARDYIFHLLNIAEARKPISETHTGNLDHNV
jgi:hypothetical protein